MAQNTITEQPPLRTDVGFRRKELDVRGLRLSYLPYTLSFVFSLWLADMQLSYFSVDGGPGGLDSSALMQVSYCLFAIVLVMLRPHMLQAFRTASIFLVAIGYLVWLLPFAPGIRLCAIVLCWGGLGGCAACAAHAYAFVLQNAERFYAALFAALGQGVTLTLFHHNILNLFMGRITPTALVVGIVLCLLLYREDDIEKLLPSPASPPRGKYVVLCCVGAYFTITVFGELLIRTLYKEYYLFYATGIICSVAITLALHIAFRRCVWHLWNLFVGASALSLLLITLSPPPFLQVGVLVYGALTGAGYTGVMYMGGGFVKRYGSVRVFRLALASACGVAISPMVASAVISEYFPQALEATTVIITFAVLLAFILLMPSFYQELFRHEWLNEYHEADMNEEQDLFARYNLSPRERSVCILLLRGHTLRQISAMLGLQYSTVNTYCTTLYRKLSINSRAELFVLFGQEGMNYPDPDND